MGCANPVRAALPEWQAAVGAGTPAASSYFKDEAGPAISGQYPVSWEVGALTGDRSFEFIVFAGETGGSSALMGLAGTQGLKFEQWNNTTSLGLTDFGVADHLSPEPSPFYAESQVVFAFDGADTLLYVNGELKHTFAAVPLEAAGLQWLGAISDAGGASFFDRLDGHILGFASYDTALPADEVADHHRAFAQNQNPYFLPAWQTAVGLETAPLTTRFTPVSGLEPVVIEVGELAGVPSTFEFVLNAGEGGASSAVLGLGGAGGQGLKYEQWNNTGFFGLTNFGVVDITAATPSTFNTILHAAYVSDGASTELYLNGEWSHSFDGTPLSLGGQVALGAAATITVTEDQVTFGDVLDGSVLRFASYDSRLEESEISAHHGAFASDGGAGAFTSWQSAVAAGTTAAAIRLEPASGQEGVTADVGALDGDRTFEFIVNAGDASASGSLLGDGTQGLRFEQWNNSGTMGLTVYGTADYATSVAPPLLTDTHIVYASDGTDTDLYVDGVWQHTFAGVPLTGTGVQGLAAAAITTVAGTVVTYFDRLDGHVLGFASYASALTSAEVARHADALLLGGVAPAPSLRITGFSREPATGQLSLTWTSTPGKTYDILHSTSLASFDQVTAAAIAAGPGASTTHPFAPPVAGALQLYFRVRQL